MEGSPLSRANVSVALSVLAAIVRYLIEELTRKR